MEPKLLGGLGEEAKVPIGGRGLGRGAIAATHSRFKRFKRFKKKGGEQWVKKKLANTAPPW
ncbi:hypothetical protein PROH_21185 [Prochlorothrix hollandica PCC 9006 = CALU 1027]|uniref:Uncharacterized protein n=1 Tax=Prochlorothrix hollandica PCC 9006 = CALU 1027 TaxID=317619 RepID=A0A0M2PU61_PROHO|nr:hypothetical protein PROH_21185 [Prochlorothrix hollandica PCC 9006 = CALU 1027]